MYTRALAFAALLAGCSAFTTAPIARTRSRLMMADSRRAAVTKFGQALGLGIAAAGMPGAAFADGAVSDASRSRARGIYGPKVLATGGAPAAVLGEETSFKLYVSGGLKRKDEQKVANAALKDLLAAAKKGDDGATKDAYKKYLAATGLDKPSPFTDKDAYQGSSSDFTWTNRTNKGYVYVR